MTTNTQTECPFDKDLRAFRDHAMSEKRRDEVRAHIRTCDACRANISLMKAVDAELKSWVAAPTPDGLRGRILAEVGVESPGSSRAPKKAASGKDARRRLRITAWQLGLVSAAVVVFVAVIILPMFAKAREKARQTSPAAEFRSRQLEAEQTAADTSSPTVIPEMPLIENPDAAGDVPQAKIAASTVSAIPDRSVNIPSKSVVYYNVPTARPSAPYMPPQVQAGAAGSVAPAPQSATPPLPAPSPFGPAPDFNTWEDYSRKIVYTATMDITVPHLADAEQKAVALVVQSGGYVTTSTSDTNDGANPNGSWTLRVPCYNFEAFIAQLEKLGKVNTLHRESQDITDQYKDLRAQINNKRIEENRLQNLLASRTRLSDVTDMEQQLSDVQGEIESLQGQLNVTENQAAFSTITLTMEENVPPAVTVTPTFGSQFGGAFKGSFEEIIGWGEGLLVWLALAWPWLVILGLIAAPIVRQIRRRQRDREDD